MTIRGALLLELALGLTLAGLLLAVGIPTLRAPLDRLAADRAAIDFAGAHARARIASVTSNRVSRLVITADSLTITVGHPPDTARLWSAAGPAGSGVAFSGPASPLRFRPAGVSFGLANGTYTFTRGRKSTAVVVSRWGRVRMVKR